MKALHVFPRQLARPCSRSVTLMRLRILFLLVSSGIGQQGQRSGVTGEGDPQSHRSVLPISLKDLIREAEQNSPEIAIAERGYAAATHVARQASALPDTQVTLQYLSVGSPRPFAGYTNSEFAYLGLGASQEIPYPGKRGLRGQVADREADVRRVQIESVRRTVTDKLKAAYFRLAYLQQTLSVLERNDQLLKDVEQIVESRYRVGQGNQQEVLKAQLQSTKILQEITMHHREVGQVEAQLKQLLNRPQESPDIQTEPLAARSLTYSAADLLTLAKQENPDVKAQQAVLAKTESQVELAKKEFRRISRSSTCTKTRTANFAITTLQVSASRYPTVAGAKPHLPRPKPAGTRRTSSLNRNCNNGWLKSRISTLWHRPLGSN